MPRVRLMLDARFSWLTASLARFTELTGIDVTVHSLAAERLVHVVRDTLPSRSAMDLLVADESIIAEAIHRGTLEPLGRKAHRDGFDLDDFPQATIDRFRASDVVYAIPAAVMSNVLHYREDILRRYDMTVPTTWDDLRTTAKNVLAALRVDGVDDVTGYAGCGLGGFDENYWLVSSTLFPSWGWKWNRGAGRLPCVHESATVDALANYVALLRESGPPNSESKSRTNALDYFFTGRSVFVIDMATASLRSEQLNLLGGSASSKMALVPAGPTTRPEPGFLLAVACIPAGSPAKEEAWELLKLLLSPEEMMNRATADGLVETPRESIFASPLFAARFELADRAVLARTRRYARVNRPLVPFGFELGEIIGAAVQSAVAGDATANNALRVAQERIDSLTWTV